MLTSIITPHFQNELLLRKLCRSLEQQSVPFEQFEWIVVDDGSRQNYPTWIESYDGPLTLDFIKLNRNHGRAFARNSGIGKARGSILAFIDSDMVVSPNWLESLVDAVKLTGGIAVGSMSLDPSLRETPFLRYYHTRGAAKLQAGSEIPLAPPARGDTDCNRA